MKIEHYDTSDYRILNPVTGEFILDEQCNDNADSLIGYWLDEVFREPNLKNEDLKRSWEAFEEKYETESEYIMELEDLVRFLDEYDNPNWKVLEITSHGIACGPGGVPRPAVSTLYDTPLETDGNPKTPGRGGLPACGGTPPRAARRARLARQAGGLLV